MESCPHHSDQLLNTFAPLKETTEHDLPWYTKSNPTIMNTFSIDMKKFECCMVTLNDSSDSPSVSPLSFYAEPMYQPIPLRLSKEQCKSRYEFSSTPHDEYHCTIFHDSTGSSFQEIQPMTSNSNIFPKAFEHNPQPLPMFVHSMVSHNDWLKFDGMKQGPMNGYRKFDSDNYPQGTSLHEAMTRSMRNQDLPLVKPFDVTNHSSSSALEEEKKPLKTLSAYNFFFRHERERILADDKDHESDDEFYSFSKKQSLLYDHWYRDRSQKRSHRKSHGKISFATLSRIVAQRWKALPENRKKFYQDLAAEDLKRYRHEILQRECGSNAPHISTLKFRPAVQMKDILFKASSFFDFPPSM